MKFDPAGGVVAQGAEFLLCRRRVIDADSELRAHGVGHGLRELCGQPVEPRGAGLFRDLGARSDGEGRAAEQFRDGCGTFQRSEFTRGFATISVRLPLPCWA